MHTTLDLNDELVAQTKASAAREHTTPTKLIEEGVRLRLNPPRRIPNDEPPPLPVFREGTGLAPSIDLLSNRDLLEAADDADRAEGRPR